LKIFRRCTEKQSKKQTKTRKRVTNNAQDGSASMNFSRNNTAFDQNQIIFTIYT
jgi:hypothetical protein